MPRQHALQRKRRLISCAFRCALLVLAWCLNHVSLALAAPPCEVISGRCPVPLTADSARGLALGTGVRATAMSTSAIAYNPAALVVGRVYQLEANSDWMPDRGTFALGGAIVDSSTSSLAAGLALRGFMSGDAGFGGIDGRASLAFALSDAISLGVTGRYVSVEYSHPKLDPGLPRSLTVAKGFTMDASLRIAPIPSVQLFVGGYNFLDRSSVYLPVMVGGGAGVSLGDIGVIGADVLVDLTTYKDSSVNVGGGLEILAGGVVPLRIGYSYDTKREQHTISGGLGYTDKAVGLDLSLRQDMGGAGDTRAMLAIRFYVH